MANDIATPGRRHASIGQSTLRNVGATAICLAVVAVHAVVTLVPWLPIGAGEPDFSFRLRMHQAFLSGESFDRLICTFGPWGFLFDGYHPATIALVHGCWTVMAFAIAASLFALLRSVESLGASTILTIGAVSATAAGGTDAVLYLPFLILIALEDRTEGMGATRIPGAASFLVGALIALCSLIKFSFFILAAALVLLLALAALRSRRIQGIAGFTIALPLLWMAGAQPPATFASWMARSFQVASGYAGAASIVQPSSHLAMALFVAAAIGLTVITALGRMRDSSSAAIIYFAGVGSVCFVILKAGFVRADELHMRIPAAVLLAAAPMLLSTSGLGRRYRGVAPAYLLTAVVSIAIGIPLLQRNVDWIAHRSWLSQEPAFRARVRRELEPCDLSGVEGPIDSYPLGSAILAESGFRTSPRPVVQSYMAWTPYLARLDAAFLASPAAPHTVLIQLKPLDDDAPTGEDTLSWLALLSRYDYARSAGCGALLTRRAVPRPIHLSSVRRLTVVSERWLEVGSIAGQRMLWLDLHPAPSIGERLRVLLFAPTPLNLELDGTSGTRRFRLPRSGGLLINPVPESEAGLESLFGGHPIGRLRRFRVSAASEAEREREERRLSMQIELYVVDIDR